MQTTTITIDSNQPFKPAIQIQTIQQPLGLQLKAISDRSCQTGFNLGYTELGTQSERISECNEAS